MDGGPLSIELFREMNDRVANVEQDLCMFLRVIFYQYSTRVTVAY